MSGPNLCMNLSPLRLLNPFCPILLGKLDFYQRWKDGLTQCRQCNGRVKAISGVICGNFGHEQIQGYRCSGVYHAKCYRQHDDNRFPVLGDDNADNSLMGVNDLEPDDPQRFKETRDGDHMMLPFQCDMCHFINIYHQLPIVGNSGDDLLIKVICQANLDSLWARERSTVCSNFAEAKRSVRIKSTFQMDHRILPQLGPFPLEDIWGVGEAVCLLWWTLDPEKMLSKFNLVRYTDSELLKQITRRQLLMV